MISLLFHLEIVSHHFVSLLTEHLDLVIQMHIKMVYCHNQFIPVPILLSNLCSHRPVGHYPLPTIHPLIGQCRSADISHRSMSKATEVNTNAYGSGHADVAVLLPGFAII